MLTSLGWLKSKRGVKSALAGNHYLIRSTDSIGPGSGGSSGGSIDPEGSLGTPSTSNGDDGSTSNAWIAGAVIGPLVAVALIGFAVWFIRRRRRTAHVDHAPHEMSGEGYHPPYKAEKVAQGPMMLHELGGTKAPAGRTLTHQELPGNDEPIHELPANSK